MSTADFVLPFDYDTALHIPADEAITIASKALGLPILGGPSGRGWSWYSTAQRCGHLFNIERLKNPQNTAPVELRHPSAPLQIGTYYHALQALYYAVGLGDALLHNRGLRAASVRRGFSAWWANPINIKARTFRVDPMAADHLLDRLKLLADQTANDLAASVDDSINRQPRPNASYIAEAERAFDVHTGYYGDGREEVQPLAIEWHATHPDGYTCRYDTVGALLEGDRLVQQSVFKPGDVVVYERKTSAWMSQAAQFGWSLEGEILGELWCWDHGPRQLFGDLKAIIVDVVTKEKKPKCERLILQPHELPALPDFVRSIRYTDEEITQWRRTGYYPKKLAACYDRWGKCGLWDACARGE